MPWQPAAADSALGIDDPKPVPRAQSGRRDSSPACRRSVRGIPLACCYVMQRV